MPLPAVHHDLTSLPTHDRERQDDSHNDWTYNMGQASAGEWMDAPAGELSTGNARKLWIILCTLGVGVAIKFAIRSVRIILCTLGVDSLIVLDEPFSGLDAHGADTLRAEIDAWSTVSWVLLIAHGEASEPNVDDIFLGVTPSKEH